MSTFISCCPGSWTIAPKNTETSKGGSILSFFRPHVLKIRRILSISAPIDPSTRILLGGAAFVEV